MSFMNFRKGENGHRNIFLTLSEGKIVARLSINQQPIDLSLVMRKPAFPICENKDADQLRGNCEADQRLCFRYTDSTCTIPLLSKSEISSL